MTAAKMLRMGLDQSMLDLHLRTQGTESLDVLVNGTTADITAAGKCHLRMLIFSQKSTDQIIGGSDLLDIFIFYYKFNEGQGYQFKDWSGNGNDATTKDNTTPVWIQDVRIDGK